MEKIKLGRKNYELTPITGRVVNTTKNHATNINVGTKSYYNTSTNSYQTIQTVGATNTIHDQVFLVDNRGYEYAFQLRDFNVACREGNTLTIIQAVRTRINRGHYIAVINHDTRQIYYNDDAMEGICRPSRLYYLAIFILSGYICDFILNTNPVVFIVVAIIGFIACYFMTLRYNKGRIAQAINAIEFKAMHP